ncbi:tetratricopeptide repeat protein [Anabaena cylindrica UHCC 0172]|uniref:CHAT domain-containing protein n=1 Tax=Anabaena cylindrica TaxID=1165 RepID=UPI002B216089|nr:tetratricopeptide repeat protein [Anabaena cylindrica]MEA5549422.1 tetratricopeptide repeat protein [Anabaena cylindrica UHCC 0172]
MMLKKSMLALITLVSLPGIINIFLLSESVYAIPRQMEVIAQKPANTDKADQAFQEGKQLFEQKTPESLKQAIVKFEEALVLYEKANNSSAQAFTLLYIGSIHNNLGDTQKALEHFNQSLTLWQQVGETTGEATALSNIAAIYSQLGELQTALKYYQQSLPLFKQLKNKKDEVITLIKIGFIYDQISQDSKAIEYYNLALPICREIENESLEALTLNNIGKAYDDIGEKQKALESYNLALSIRQKLEDKNGEALVLNNIGKIYDDIGEEKKALEYYKQSLSISQQIDDQKNQANTLHNIAAIYDELNDQQKSLEFYHKSLPLWQKLGNQYREALALNNIGLIHSNLNATQKALEFYNQSILLRRKIKDKIGEANTLNNIAFVYNRMGENKKALEYYTQSLSIFQQLGDKSKTASTFNNLGVTYDKLGEKQKALSYYNQALILSQQVNDKNLEALAINNIGGIYDDIGESQKALDYFNQSLPITQKTGNKNLEALILNNIGGIYDKLGEENQALDYYNKSLNLFKTLGDKSRESLTLNNIGGIYNDLREKQKALDYFNQSLLLARQVSNKSREAIVLNNIGAIYEDLGEKQQALEYYQQAVLIAQQIGEKGSEAIFINNVASIYSNTGDKQKALDYYQQSLVLKKQVEDKSGEALSLYNIAYIQSDSGNSQQALTSIETAIKIVEKLRTKIGSQELRASYFATVQDYYKLYIDLLMQLHQKDPHQGYDAQALHASERGRARSLLELLTEANADIRTGVDSQLLAEESNLQQQLNTLENNKYQLLNSQYSQKQLKEIQGNIESLLTQIDQLAAKIRLTSPRYAELKYPEPLTLKQIQEQVLDDNTILLEYSLGKDRSYLWVVSKKGMTSYQLPKLTVIKAASDEFYSFLKTGKEGDLEVGQKLSQMLLQPVASQLGNKRLLIVGDGALQYIPFAALPIPSAKSGYTPLLVQNEIVSLPSASTVAILRRQLRGRIPATKTLAVIADPVFELTDTRFSGVPAFGKTTTIASSLTRSAFDVGSTLNRLEYTRKEAEKILALVPKNKRLQAFDFQASRDIATNSELGNYQIIHLATHGLLNSIHPELSGVVFSLFDQDGKSQNGFLRLQDIFNLNLPAELVVLSACETGLGEEVKGEGLVGLTRGFMYAGAKRVVVSLWSVSDVGTAELMTKFYQKMLKEGLNPMAALRMAQLEMWRNQNFSAPYYWAAFSIQGDWQ